MVARRRFMKKIGIALAGSMLSNLGGMTSAAADPRPQAGSSKSAPNIVVILVDDMGLSDFGCYGGEIPTPNIDALAKGGLRFTQFYNNARCSPTRAALLTGLNPHQAGMGYLSGKRDPQSRGTFGRLHECSVTIAQLLRCWIHDGDDRQNGILATRPGRRRRRAGLSARCRRSRAASIFRTRSSAKTAAERALVSCCETVRGSN